MSSLTLRFADIEIARFLCVFTIALPLAFLGIVVVPGARANRRGNGIVATFLLRRSDVECRSASTILHNR